MAMVRFSWGLALLLLGGCAAYAALVLATASWPEVVALRQAYDWQPAPRALTPAEFAGVRGGLGAWGLASLGLAAGWLAPARGRAGLAELAASARQLGQELRASWRDLSPGQRRLAGASLALLTGARLYYSGTEQAFDDATSYELFVREKLLAVSAAYPLPNNHVGSNTLDWLFYQVNPGFWFSMRLPVLLTSTAATGLWFLGLLRRSNFRVALLAVGWFALPLESLYYAANGRGYWLLVLLGAFSFFALQPLLDGRGSRRRLAAVVLVGSGVLGLYAVPTQLLLLGPLYGWWGLVLLRRRAYRALGLPLVLGGLTLLGAGLLYAPLLLISGLNPLLHHPYVAPLAPAVFRQFVRATLWQSHQLIDLPLAVGALLGLGGLVRRARAGQLPPARARQVWQLGLPSAWLALLPYAMAVAQRSWPPERTLLYKAQYTFLPLALLADYGLRQLGARGRRGAWVALAAGTLGFGAGQGLRLARQEAQWRAAFGRPQAAPVARWLATQPAGPVLAPEPAQRFLLRYYGGTALQAPPWRLDARPRPGVRYRYLVTQPGEAPQYRGRPLPGPAAASCPAFTIFRIP